MRACFVQQKVFSYKEVQFKRFCPPVKISCHHGENIYETLEVGRKDVWGWEGGGTEKG